MKKILSLCLVLFLGFSSYTSAFDFSNSYSVNETIPTVGNFYIANNSYANYLRKSTSDGYGDILLSSDKYLYPFFEGSIAADLNTNDYYNYGNHFKRLSNARLFINDNDYTLVYLYYASEAETEQKIPINAHRISVLKNHNYEKDGIIYNQFIFNPVSFSFVSDFIEGSVPQVLSFAGGKEYKNLFFGFEGDYKKGYLVVYDFKQKLKLKYENHNKHRLSGGYYLEDTFKNEVPYQVNKIEIYGCNNEDITKCSNHGGSNIFNYVKGEGQTRMFLSVVEGENITPNIYVYEGDVKPKDTDEEHIAYNVCKGKFKGLEKYTLLSKSCYEEERRPPRVPPANGTGVWHGIQNNQITEPATDYQYPPACNTWIKFNKTEFSNRGEGREDMQDESMVYRDNPSSLNLENYCGKEPVKEEKKGYKDTYKEDLKANTNTWKYWKAQMYSIWDGLDFSFSSDNKNRSNLWGLARGEQIGTGKDNKPIYIGDFSADKIKIRDMIERCDRLTESIKNDNTKEAEQKKVCAEVEKLKKDFKEKYQFTQEAGFIPPTGNSKEDFNLDKFTPPSIVEDVGKQLSYLKDYVSVKFFEGVEFFSPNSCSNSVLFKEWDYLIYFPFFLIVFYLIKFFRGMNE